MLIARLLGMLIVAFLFSDQLSAQTQTNDAPGSAEAPANPWAFDLSISGYDVPHGRSFVSPTLTADHDTLHMEARYNYEGLDSGSLWFGYNLSVGKKVTLEATPMIGGVFGSVTGIAPGVEFTVTYKKIQLFSANEYIFDTTTKARNFFYTWTQALYSPVPWFSVGYVLQRTRAYSTALDIQRGVMVQFTHKKTTFAAQGFNMGQTDPVIVFSLGYSF
jgi:hypothetical protein